MIITADARDLSMIADKSCRCCVTSPPYYGLRDYGVDGQIGLESTPEEYVAQLVLVFREVWKKLTDDGTLWLNIGDSYAGGKRGGNSGVITGKGKDASIIDKSKRNLPRWGGGNNQATGNIKPKDLIGIPWMVAFALRADGWYLRSDIIWAKPNPMPESVKDRPTKSHEYLFLLSKSQKYYYDAEAIYEPANYDGRKDTVFKGSLKYDADTLSRVGGERWPNKIRGFKTKDQIDDNQHHGSDIKNSRTGSNIVGHSGNFNADGKPNISFDNDGVPARNKRTVWTINTQPFKNAHFAVMPEQLIEPCILAGSRPGDTVLDPFGGSGTVGVVAKRFGRDFILVDINKDYSLMEVKRTERTPASLFQGIDFSRTDSLTEES